MSECAMHKIYASHIRPYVPVIMVLDTFFLRIRVFISCNFHLYWLFMSQIFGTSVLY